MLISNSHKSWLLGTAGCTVIATVLYLWSVDIYGRDSGGNTLAGLSFGILALVAMVWTWLLAARKRARAVQLGKVSFWVKGHLWIGLLSVPLVFFHTDFRFGGTLEKILMTVFIVVIISGIIGQVIQQFVPRFMMATLEKQAIPEQIDNAVSALQKQADELVVEACDTLFEPSPDTNRTQIDYIREFYLTYVRTFLQARVPKDLVLINAAQAASVFETQKQSVSIEHRELLDRLFVLCEERRQLLVQPKWQTLMHGWTLIHVPLSFALLVLVVIHILTAIYY